MDDGDVSNGVKDPHVALIAVLAVDDHAVLDDADADSSVACSDWLRIDLWLLGTVQDRVY